MMAHGDAREVKWRGNWRMEWVASTPHTTSELCVSTITTADPHTTTASSRLNWLPCRFKWTRPFRRKTKSGLCACAITFQSQSTSPVFTGGTETLRQTSLMITGLRAKMWTRDILNTKQADQWVATLGLYYCDERLGSKFVAYGFREIN